MAGAKIHSLDAIKHFRVAMIKFAETVNAALGNADSDVNRAQVWIDNEAKSYWQSEIRKREAALKEALEKLRMKTLYKNFDGTTQSAVDEKKIALLAKQKLEIAQQKLAAVRKYSALMQRESVMYKGSVTRFSTTIQSGTPVAIAQLGRVMEAIERYFAAAPEMGVVASGTAGDPSTPAYASFLAPVTRPEADEPGAGDPAPAGEEKEAAPPAAAEPEPAVSKTESATSEPQ